MNEIYSVDTGFLNKGKYLWYQKVIAGMFKKLEEFKSYELKESEEKCFDVFLQDMRKAQNVFLTKINDLPLIMKCRTMCDDDSHFGGQECAEYMEDIRKICEKYLKDSEFSDNIVEGSIASAIMSIRAKARQDELAAWEIENKNIKAYEISGKDNSLEIFKSAGYDV